ncbi:MAG: MFS transporter [Ginsengibacter sp.]
MMNSTSKTISRELLRIPVLAAALGYLVDMYDLFLFTIVRVPSLKSLGLSGKDLLDNGILLLNLQMAGMLIGGIFWGILGDKKGRLSVLFGSILIYSVANIGNGFVTTIHEYALMRFIAGFGLAGELGVGVTLVVEILPKNVRGYGTTLVATMGVFGALLAFLIVHYFNWRISYYIGGGLGLFLMVLRIKVFESGIFMNLKNKNIRRGNIRLLFNNKTRLIKYINSILIGMPIWFVAGILITFSPEFGQAMKLNRPVDAGVTVLFIFGGQVAGNIASGFLSQYLQSRKKAIFLFMFISFLFVLSYLVIPFHSIFIFYLICVFLGFFSGYWTLFITVAAELFGTDLRATVATTVPNFVRSTVIPLTALFALFKDKVGIIHSALMIGVVTFAIAILALFYLEETFKKEMDYTESP